MSQHLAFFENYKIRRTYDERTETWLFSVVDIMQVLTQQSDFQAARKYWNKLKERLKKEGSESVTNCHQLKLEAADGKKYLTDVASAETILRLIQSVPSPKAEPVKLWLAKVGYERMQEMADPARSLDRARETWKKHGRSEKWIQQRMMGQETRNKLTDYWKDHEIKEGEELERQMGLTRGTIQYVLDRGSLRYDLAQKIAKHIGKKIAWVDSEK